MLEVLILEDNDLQRQMYHQIIQRRIEINDTPKAYDMEIAVCTPEPKDILNYLNEHRNARVFALLDIQIDRSNLNGINVAEKIRTQQPFAAIAFITTHDEMLKLTLSRKVEPLDFIYKEAGSENVTQFIREDVDTAYERYQKDTRNSEVMFSYEVARDRFRELKFSDLYYVESLKDAPRKLLLRGRDVRAEFRGELRQVEKDNPNLIRCDRSILINPQNVVIFDFEQRVVYFDEQRKVSCKVSARKAAMLRRYLKGIAEIKQGV
ncbi:DNA-binding response regulator [Lactobacillus sp. CC-MHH1034]|uniref:LytTR family transcriptional regulator DNA-binding domain-containing protein n=1 Tax=Agrilactobacillus fermenti TaxID=2586909 RepID=UPI001E55D318|nr:LytTR family transcriptional regulator DNA-binding domain-containing protein [Agrilactobacillus fermenti]MCD2255758.1 DNA-binding response regulator [Agrilactobacillus fermenti]